MLCYAGYVVFLLAEGVFLPGCGVGFRICLCLGTCCVNELVSQFGICVPLRGWSRCGGSVPLGYPWGDLWECLMLCRWNSYGRSS